MYIYDYYCTDCRYKFKSKGLIDRCPNCHNVKTSWRYIFRGHEAIEE